MINEVNCEKYINQIILHKRVVKNMATETRFLRGAEKSFLFIELSVGVFEKFTNIKTIIIINLSKFSIDFTAYSPDKSYFPILFK